jgi:general secretion pathway protein F
MADVLSDAIDAAAPDRSRLRPDQAAPTSMSNQGSSKFRYRALDQLGQRTQGEVIADTQQAALVQLRQRGLSVLALTVDTAGSVDPGSQVRPERRRVRAADRIVLLHEFSTLLTAGVPIAEATPSLEAAYANTALGPPLTRLRKAVQGGRTVAEAFRVAGLDLPEHAHSLIAAGEAAGRLGQALHAAAAQLEYDHAVAQQVRTALIYPSVLIGAGVSAVMIIFISVVPRFASLLGNGRAEVPALSRWVIEMGMFLQAHLLGSALVLSALVGAAVLAARVSGARQAVIEALARMPLIGPWLYTSEIGRWATLLGTLLENRVALLPALELSSRAVSLSSLRGHLNKAQGEIRRGRALSAILAEQGWIAPTRLNLIRVGERAGELPRMLVQLGSMHTVAAREQMRRLLALIEPLAILLIGAVIGVIMVAVVLAITSLNTAKL